MFGLEINYSERTFCFAQRKLSQNDFRIQKCEECGRNVLLGNQPQETLCFLLGGGKRYPDFLYYGGAGMHFLLSEQALKLFEENRISGYQNASEVELCRTVGNQLLRMDDMQYYAVDICGSIDFDLGNMALKKKNVCPKCGQFDWNRQRLYLVDTVLDKRSWDGADLCRISSAPGYILCSEKLKELIAGAKLSGVTFRNENELFKTF